MSAENNAQIKVNILIYRTRIGVSAYGREESVINCLSDELAIRSLINCPYTRFWNILGPVILISVLYFKVVHFY